MTRRFWDAFRVSFGSYVSLYSAQSSPRYLNKSYVTGLNNPILSVPNRSWVNTPSTFSTIT